MVDGAESLPAEALRDLLGITRAVYAAAASSHVTKPWLRELAEVGRELTALLALTRRPASPTEHRTAWRRAERVTRTLLRLLRAPTDVTLDSISLEQTLEAAIARIRRAQPLRSSQEREQKKAHVRMRS